MAAGNMNSAAAILEDTESGKRNSSNITLPISVIVAVRNEERNLPMCLDSLLEVGEVFVVDSESTDATVEIAKAYGANVVQFKYPGGWPKKRQWAMDSLPLAYDWVLLLDADEALTPELCEEIRARIQNQYEDGYYVKIQMSFLGRRLRHCGAEFKKLSLFRKGKGHFECRLKDQDETMCDMEVHEHIVVDGSTATLKNPVIHNNVESLDRYISKHNQYSNWDAAVWMRGNESRELPPSLLGNQAQRRRWLRKLFFSMPGLSIGLFLYRYFLRLGLLDGTPGLIYCAFQAMQMFNVKAKIYELQQTQRK
jgi:glycosyltransferase involved in cell wall biosynthesis